MIASVEIRAGNVGGRSAFVMLTATGTAFTNSATGLPMYGFFGIREEGGGDLIAPEHSFHISELAGNYGSDSAAVVAVVEVPTGVDLTFELWGRKLTSTSTPKVYGSIAATYFPFSGDGDNSINLPKAPSPVSDPFLGR